MGTSALAAFGRSGADRMIMNFLQENRMQKESGSRIAIQEAQLEKYNREKAIADKETARRGTSMDVRKWADEKLPGGSEGAYGRAMIGEAKRRGDLDISGGDMGSISQGAGEDIFAELDKNPTWAAKIHGEHLGDLHKKRQSIMTAMAEKPNDKNMQEQLEQTNRQIQQATEIMPGIKAEIKRQDEIKKAEVLAKSNADIEIRKAEAIATKEARKAPTLKTMKNKDGKWTFHSWDKDTKQWVDTGQISKDEGAGTGEERKRATLIAKLPEFQRMAKEDPNKLYKEKSIKMNDDGTIPTNAFGAPTVLPPPHKVLGKRTSVTAVMQLGEHYYDAVHLQELLDDPEVARDLKSAADGGYWDRTKGTVSNKIRKWMRNAGIHPDSKTATAIGRMEKMGSELRKKYLGSAVTVPELKTFKPWAPSAGDSYEQMLNKNRLLVSEGKEEFVRFLDYYKNQANMSSLYNAFHIKRFSESSKQIITQAEYDALIRQDFSDEQIKEKYEVQ